MLSKDGFSNIYWRIYTEESSIKNNPPEAPPNGYTILKHLSRLKDLELRLRSLDCLVSCYPRRLGLWVFSPTPEFDHLQPFCPKDAKDDPKRILIGSSILKGWWPYPIRCPYIDYDQPRPPEISLRQIYSKIYQTPVYTHKDLLIPHLHLDAWTAILPQFMHHSSPQSLVPSVSNLFDEMVQSHWVRALFSLLLREMVIPVL